MGFLLFLIMKLSCSPEKCPTHRFEAVLPSFKTKFVLLSKNSELRVKALKFGIYIYRLLADQAMAFANKENKQ